jgi:hypothetical protein
MQMRNDREGFALPMAILVIGFMTAGVVASFTRVGAEVQSVDNVRGQTAAFAMADAGLAQFMTTGSLPSSTTSTSTTYTYAGGTATVTARRLHRVGNSSLVLISSVGTAASPVGRPRAQRTVAQFARQEPIDMQVLSSWTSLSGVYAHGNNGAFDGVDAAGSMCGDGVTRAGIAVPDNLATSTGTNNSHIEERASGDPPIDYLGTKQQAADAIQIDWAGLINPAGPAIPPHAIRCAASTSTGYVAGLGPCGSWPANFNNYPTTMINGSMALPSSGKGLLIVTGNLEILGNQNWDGIILVGGKITDNGQGMISGSVVSGLNMTIGQTVEESNVDQSMANGTKRYEFDSCKVQDALLGASTGFSAIPNAWVDNWAQW